MFGFMVEISFLKAPIGVVTNVCHTSQTNRFVVLQLVVRSWGSLPSAFAKTMLTQLELFFGVLQFRLSLA
jgi:hypothetical protein